MKMDSLSHPAECLLCILCLIVAAAGTAFADNKVFEARVFQGEGEQSMPYRLLKPANYNPQTAYPLVLFLHGAGERGTDNEAQLLHVVSVFAKPENREKFPCFLVVPQCPIQDKWADVRWSDTVHTQREQPSKSAELALKILDEVHKEFNVDAKRLYIMGISMGGFGTWDLITRNPDLFAAAVPICGGGDTHVVAKVAKLPLWVFHGAKDGLVKPCCSRDLVEVLKKAGGEPRYTEYPDLEHNSWDQASQEPELLPWLFSQKRSH